VVNLAKTRCPVLNVLRKYANIAPIPPEPRRFESNEGFDRPDMDEIYVAPEPTRGQRYINE
jgi:hypothetical protein